MTLNERPRKLTVTTTNTLAVTPSTTETELKTKSAGARSSSMNKGGMQTATSAMRRGKMRTDLAIGRRRKIGRIANNATNIHCETRASAAMTTPLSGRPTVAECVRI